MDFGSLLVYLCLRRRAEITEFEIVGMFSEVLFQRKVGKEESIERSDDHILRKIKHGFIKILSYM